MNYFYYHPTYRKTVSLPLLTFVAMCWPSPVIISIPKDKFLVAQFSVPCFQRASHLQQLYGPGHQFALHIPDNGLLPSAYRIRQLQTIISKVSKNIKHCHAPRKLLIIETS